MDWWEQREDYSRRSLDHNSEMSYFDPNPSFSFGWRLRWQAISEEDARVLVRLTASCRGSPPRLLKLLETNRGPDCTCAADDYYPPPYALL